MINIQSITKGLIQEIEGYDQEFGNRIKEISNFEYKYLNLKIAKVETNENNQVNNPHHTLNFNCENFWILGDTNKGKTTFFDKIYDFFINPDLYGPPIKKNVINNSSLELYNENENRIKLEIKSNSENKTSHIFINSKQNREKLEYYGLYNNDLNLVNFITQKVEDDFFFKNNNYNLNNFFSFSSRYLHRVNILKVINSFKTEIRKLNSEKLRLKMDLSSMESQLIDLDFEIETLESKIRNIEIFLEYSEEIRLFLENYEKNDRVDDLSIEKRRLTEKIKKLENEIRKEDVIKKYESNIYSKSDKNTKDNFLDLEPFCPICGNSLTLKSFSDRFQDDLCYLCGLFNFDYNKDDKEAEEKEGIQKSNEISRTEKLNSLKKSMEMIKTKINDEMSKNSEIEVNLKRILNHYYLDLIRPGFSIDEEIKRKKKKLENFKYLKKSKIEKRRDLEAKLEKKRQDYDKISNSIKFLKSKLKMIKENEEVYINKLVLRIAKEIRYYWPNITKDPIGNVFYNPNDKTLNYITVSQNNRLWQNQIKNIRNDNQLSDSALNGLRYAIHLSFLKVIFDEMNYLPLKIIFIDTPDYQINKNFYKVLEDDFVKKRGFQIIILSTKKEDPFESWNYERFDKYKRRKDMDGKIHQMVLDYFLEKRND